MRIGIVGAGAIVQVAHLPVMKRLKGVEVVGICDTDLQKARALALRHGIPSVSDDLEEMLGTTPLDAVVVCTPNHLHEAHILAALSAGAHVLVEKPLAINTASARRVIKAAERSDRLVMVGVHHRYRSDIQTIHSFVSSGELGTIDSVRASWHVARPARAQLGWRQRPDLSGGGAMLDLGSTLIDLCLWLTGHPTPARVSAALAMAGRERLVEQSGDALVICEGGPSIFIDVTWRHIGQGEHFGVGIRGSKGTAGINPLQVWKEMHGVAHDVSPTGSGSRENLFISSFRAQWAHFLAAIAGEAEAPSLDEQLTVLRVLEAVYQSHQAGRDVAP